MSLKSKIKNTIKLVFDRDFRIVLLTGRGKLAYMSDEDVVKHKYRYNLGKTLNLENPITYTEKLQWLKLYDHRPEYKQMVDKLAAKEFVKRRIGEEYIIPTLGIWDSPEDINFDLLPDRFVLKCTHDSGGLVICKDRSKLDIEAVKLILKKCLERDYYLIHREWVYKDVPRKIIAEPYMEDYADGELRDYKFFTFSGVPKVLYIAQGRGTSKETTADFYDMNFNHLDLTIDHEMSEQKPHQPKNFEEMKNLASILSKGTPQLRVDFYEVNGKVYFGEMTFFHCSGFKSFTPNEWDYTFGEWLILPERTNED